MVLGCVYLFLFLVFCLIFFILLGVDVGNDDSILLVVLDIMLIVNMMVVVFFMSISNDMVKEKIIMEIIKDNKDMLMRVFYVLIGVIVIVVIYFGVRVWR